MNLICIGVHARFSRWCVGFACGLALMLCAVNLCPAQGVVRITFDGPPTVRPPGGSVFIQSYSESGMSFAPLSPAGGFVRVWPGNDIDPYDETIFIRAGRSDETLAFSTLDHGLFQLLSVDLAEFNIVSGPRTVPFVGYRFDGSTVSTNFTTDGIVNHTPGDFQTFYFDAGFSGLTRVEIATPGWSLDNLVVSIPEPTSAALLLAGGALFLLRSGWTGRRFAWSVLCSERGQKEVIRNGSVNDSVITGA